MNTIKLTTTQLLAIAFLLCGSITIQIHATPTLRANGKIAFVSERDGDSAIYVTYCKAVRALRGFSGASPLTFRFQPTTTPTAKPMSASIVTVFGSCCPARAE